MEANDVIRQIRAAGTLVYETDAAEFWRLPSGEIYQVTPDIDHAERVERGEDRLNLILDP